MQEHDPHHLENTSRREFLGKTAAALGAGAALSACESLELYQATGPAKERAPLADGEKIRMGVIGTGGMGTGHCGSIIRLNKDGRENVEIVALADVCKPRLENAYNVCTEGQPGVEVETYRDYKKLLARDDLHGVLIASPEHWHADHAIDAIVAGKDVYLEKPMTLRLKDSMRLRHVLESNPDMILQVGTQMIQLPKYTEAKKLIADGAIGKPTCSQTSYCRNSIPGEWTYYGIDERVVPGEMLDWTAWCGPMGTQPWDTYVYHRWRRYSKWSTGIIGDLLVHVMTPMVMALDVGWPTRVVATGGHYVDKDMDNHDQVDIVVQFEGEHTMVVMGSTCNDQGIETMIRGHQATMYLGGNNVRIVPQNCFVKEDPSLEEVDVQLPDIGNDQDAHRVAWMNSIRTREQPVADVELSTKIMVIVDLATRSMWEGHAFDFDPERMKAFSA